MRLRGTRRAILFIVVILVGVAASWFLLGREELGHREAEAAFHAMKISRPFAVRSRTEHRDGYTYVIDMNDGQPLTKRDLTPPPSFRDDTGPGPQLSLYGQTTVALFGGGLPNGGQGRCSIVVNQATENPGSTATVWTSCWPGD